VAPLTLLNNASIYNGAAGEIRVGTLAGIDIAHTSEGSWSVLRNDGLANWADGGTFRIAAGSVLELQGDNLFARSDQLSGSGSVVFSDIPTFQLLQLGADYLGTSFSFDAGPLIFRSATVANGQLLVDTDPARLRYTPNAGFVGLDTFSYTIYDSFGDIFATVNGTVEVVNTDPVAGDDSAETDEDTRGRDRGARQRQRR
jgi:hypothetical protein